jgi:hypothetical protein
LPVVACSPRSGSLFSIGQTTVTCRATDRAGNVASGGFVINVLGLPAPPPPPLPVPPPPPIRLPPLPPPPPLPPLPGGGGLL